MTNFGRQPTEPATDWRAQTMHAKRPDVGDRLPAAARDKLQSLRRELRDARALQRVPTEAAQEAREAILEIEGRISHLTRRENYAEDHPLVLAERENLARFRNDQRRHQAEAAATGETINSLAHTVTRLEGYIRSVEAGAFSMAPTPPLAMKKSETFGDAVTRVRERIGALQAELAEIEAAPIPSNIAKDRARAQIDALASRGLPDVLPLIDQDAAIEFAKLRMGADYKYNDPPDALALVAWLHRDALLQKIEAEIDANADDAVALDDQTRRKKALAAAKALLDAARDEEAIIAAAADAHVSILRRADADPRAILGLADDMPAAQ